jgi:Putative auto-transporter adhesin, head GIN domain
MNPRRRWLRRIAVLSLAWPASRGALGADTAVETRAVSGFDAVRLDAAGELSIEQTQREHLSIEAEPAVLRRIVTEVRQRRLHIGFTPGHFQTRLPIRFRLELKSLVDLDAQGSGDVRIGRLTTPALSLRLDGSGDLHLAHLSAGTLSLVLDGSGRAEVGGGAVQSQRVAIRGSSDYAAPRVASRETTVAIEGSGEVRVAAAERLTATIDGSGDILYLGQPRITQAIRGSGEVRRLDPRFKD